MVTCFVRFVQRAYFDSIKERVIIVYDVVKRWLDSDTETELTHKIY